jgi:hypothetical protein
MSYAALPFQRVTYTCRHCGATQRIPLRRIHLFERFHGLGGGEAVLIQCPHCGEGPQMPSPYRAHTGQRVEIDPDNPPGNAVIHDQY